MTKRCAVIGSPISHSLSPLLHRTAYQVLGITDFTYDAIEVKPAQLGTFINSLTDDWVGLSVTAPNKEALTNYGHPDAIASELRAANTIIFDAGDNRVYNTDVTGFVAALKHSGVEDLACARVLGAGATARAVLSGLSQLGANNVEIKARNRERAKAGLAQLAENLGLKITYAPFDSLPEKSVDLVVNTVPIQLPKSLVEALANSTQNVFEVTYNHYPTTLEQVSRRANKNTLGGIDMLVWQAIDQIELMTGRRPEAKPLLEAGLMALQTKKAPAKPEPGLARPEGFEPPTF